MLLIESSGQTFARPSPASRRAPTAPLAQHIRHRDEVSHSCGRRPAGAFSGARPRSLVGLQQRRAFQQGNGPNNRDPSLDDYVEVKVESVRVSQGSSVVYLRVLDTNGLVIAVHIGENESNALLKEINKQRQMRPLTHDVMKNMMQAIGFRVTKIRITDIIANTYYARVHLGKAPGGGGEAADEVDVDARPSDAINLAVRFGAPMYVSRRIAANAVQPMPEAYGGGGGGGGSAASAAAAGMSVGAGAGAGESHAEIVRSVREALASYEDPTIMFQLQKELAVKEERFEDAASLQAHIWHEMTHNQLLRLVVAMETALSDGRYEEAARLRDEYRSLNREQQRRAAEQAAAGGGDAGAASV